MSKTPTILFLCTGNACRSQMAEGWARHLFPGAMAVESAGTEPQGLNPNAVQVMAEAGVDISKHTSKHIDSLQGRRFDYVITVCDRAHQACPTYPRGARVINVDFDDPPRLADDSESEQEALDHYRRVRDEIRDFIRRLPTRLGEEPTR